MGKAKREEGNRSWRDLHVTLRALSQPPTMAFSSASVPRKAMPLNDSDSERAPRSSTPSGLVTKRAFFCGVVVETDLDGKDITRGTHQYTVSSTSLMSFCRRTGYRRVPGRAGVKRTYETPGPVSQRTDHRLVLELGILGCMWTLAHDLALANARCSQDLYLVNARSQIRLRCLKLSTNSSLPSARTSSVFAFSRRQVASSCLKLYH